MDLYSLERSMLERHHEMASMAEARTRLSGWTVQARFAELLAGRLRRLADRLDRPQPSFEPRLRVLGERFGDPGGPDGAEATSSGATRIRTA
jgi:hypothetical protein